MLEHLLGEPHDRLEQAIQPLRAQLRREGRCVGQAAAQDCDELVFLMGTRGARTGRVRRRSGMWMAGLPHGRPRLGALPQQRLGMWLLGLLLHGRHKAIAPPPVSDCVKVLT
jgi:hypothetical protein